MSFDTLAENINAALEECNQLRAENERLKTQVRLAGVSAEATVHEAVGRAATDYLVLVAKHDELKAENATLRDYIAALRKELGL